MSVQTKAYSSVSENLIFSFYENHICRLYLLQIKSRFMFDRLDYVLKLKALKALPS